MVLDHKMAPATKSSRRPYYSGHGEKRSDGVFIPEFFGLWVTEFQKNRLYRNLCFDTAYLIAALAAASQPLFKVLNGHWSGIIEALDKIAAYGSQEFHLIS